MVDISAIAGVATSLRSIVEITRAMKDVHDANTIQTKVFELTREITAAQACALEAQTSQLDLLQRQRDLEEELEKLKNFEAEKPRYELKAIQTGVAVYALKAGMEQGEPPHYLCTTCFTQGHKSILQREVLNPGMTVMHVCHHCSSEFIEHGMREPGHPKIPRQRR